MVLEVSSRRSADATEWFHYIWLTRALDVPRWVYRKNDHMRVWDQWRGSI